MISIPVYGEKDFKLEPEDDGSYILTEDEIQALGEYIVELENYKEKHDVLKERLEVERKTHDEAIKKADKTINALEKENKALKEEQEAMEKTYKRSNIFRDAKIAGGGAAIASVIVALTVLK
ncbi:MAG: hypothetical protein ACOCRO_00485 [Halanaerobiales bacterium]